MSGDGLSCAPTTCPQTTLDTQVSIAPNTTSWLVVLVGTRPAAPVSLALNAAGVNATMVSQGPAFLARDADFHGFNVEATVPGPVGKARVIQDASFEQEAAGRMFAFFYGETNSNDLVMGYDHPAGSESGARSYRVDGAEPGAYRFRIDRNTDEAVLFLTPFPFIFVFGADVPIPLPAESSAADSPPNQEDVIPSESGGPHPGAPARVAPVRELLIPSS